MDANLMLGVGIIFVVLLVALAVVGLRRNAAHPIQGAADALHVHLNTPPPAAAESVAAAVTRAVMNALSTAGGALSEAGRYPESPTFAAALRAMPIGPAPVSSAAPLAPPPAATMQPMVPDETALQWLARAHPEEMPRFREWLEFLGRPDVPATMTFGDTYTVYKVLRP